MDMGPRIRVLLIFGLHGTWDTITFGQTNSWRLVLLLLYWRGSRDPGQESVWRWSVIKLYMEFFADALALETMASLDLGQR